MNLVVEGRGGRHAVAGSARGRLFFLAPWRGASIAGTSHDPWTGTADQLVPRREFVDQLLADVNTAFPRAGIDGDEIRLVHRGLLPASEASPRRVTLLRDSPFIDHGEDGCAHLFSLVGVRYTTARHSAERAVDAMTRALGIHSAACATATTRLDGGDIDRFDVFLAEARRQATDAVPAALIERLVFNYGTRWQDVISTGTGSRESRVDDGDGGRDGSPNRRADLLQPLGTGCDVTRAEILYAVREEMAVTLGDALLRRTEAGSRGHPGRAAVEAAADVMTNEIGWSATRRADEIQALARVYDAAVTRGN
jgi:glycerol-3-phosphate dehydrogenase